jgi:hypothetical protein
MASSVDSVDSFHTLANALVVHALANASAELSPADALGLLVPLANAFSGEFLGDGLGRWYSLADALDSFYTLVNALVSACLGEYLGGVSFGGSLELLVYLGVCLGSRCLGECLGFCVIVALSVEVVTKKKKAEKKRRRRKFRGGGSFGGVVVWDLSGSRFVFSCWLLLVCFRSAGC